MLVYALADNRLAETVELYVSREEAEKALADVLADEPPLCTNFGARTWCPALCLLSSFVA